MIYEVVVRCFGHLYVRRVEARDEEDAKRQTLEAVGFSIYAERKEPVLRRVQ